MIGAITLAALMSGALAPAAGPAASGGGYQNEICDAVRAMSPRVLGCDFSSGPDGATWLVIRYDRPGLAADYAAAYKAAAAEADPAGERHRQAFLIEHTAERGAVYALAHDRKKRLSEVRIDEGRGPRVIRRDTIEACGSTSGYGSSTKPDESESLLRCLASVQPSVFTLIDGK